MNLRTLGAIVACVLIARSARADDVSQGALAEKLFRNGRELLAEGKVREACESFRESKQLDPTPGTLLNLGACLEELGRTASAWAVYRELAERATKRGQTARAEHASQKAAELEPQIPTLEIRIPAPHRLDGLAVECDGIALGSAALSARVPVDPGRHQIVARAPGRKAWTASVDAVASRATPVDVPLLAPAPSDRPAAATTNRPGSSSPLRPVGIGLTLVGGAATVTGLVFGGLAKMTNDDATRETCVAAGCTADGAARIRRADDLATVSTVVTVSGLSLAAIGAALWVLAPTRAVDGARVSMSMGPGALRVEGTF